MNAVINILINLCTLLPSNILLIARCTRYNIVIKFVSDLRQVSGFLWVLWFPPPVKLTATKQLKYC